MYKNIQVSLF